MSAAIATSPISPESIMRSSRREFEALVCGVLMRTVGRAAQKQVMIKSGLVAKEVYLPSCDYTMYYHEREAVIDDGDEPHQDVRDQPTLLFFHGITMRSEELAGFIASLDIPPHIRILCPEQMGHGRDIDNRLRADPNNYTLPTHHLMLETTSEFLDVVKCSSNTNAFGISLGGGVGYYLQHHRPDIIKRSVLVSPAILCCVDKDLVKGIKDGTNNFCSLECRRDAKLLMRDLSTGRDDDTRKKKDPVPKFFLETVYRESKKKNPEGHFRELLLNLLDTTEHPYAAVNVKDIDKESDRLVIWPEKDRVINFEEGKLFFGVSSSEDGDFVSTRPNTEFVSIPDCGHMFNSEGRGINGIVRPIVRDYLLDFSG